MNAGEETKAGGDQGEAWAGTGISPGFTCNLHSERRTGLNCLGTVLAKSNRASATSTSCSEMVQAVENLHSFEDWSLFALGFVRFIDIEEAAAEEVEAVGEEDEAAA